MQFIDKKTIKLNRELSELDLFAFDFCRILSKHLRYVVISGYVAILFGRSRGTEDIDIFIEEVEREKFNRLYDNLKENKFTCITADKKDAFDNLKDNIPIRFARGNTFIPNIEVKFPKKAFDTELLNKNLRVVTSSGEVKISLIEPQIAFKEVCLCSDKDMEDALHLRKVFEGHLDNKKIESYKKLFEETD